MTRMEIRKLLNYLGMLWKWPLDIRVVPLIQLESFGQKLVVLHTILFIFNKVLVHAWNRYGGFNKELIFIHRGFNSIWACQEVLKQVRLSMNWYRMFYAQTSTPNPSIHQKLTNQESFVWKTLNSQPNITLVIMLPHFNGPWNPVCIVLVSPHFNNIVNLTQLTNRSLMTESIRASPMHIEQQTYCGNCTCT